MTFGIRTANDGTYVAITSGTEDVARFGGRNGDNSGQLAGFRNILLNPRISAGVNQRGVVNWAAVANGAYGYDRWKKVDGSNILQIVEEGNYVPNAVYTLSGDGVVTGQVTAPASGHWTTPAIPITATNVQLEKGYIASDRENRLGLELLLCQRYYYKTTGYPLGFTISISDLYCPTLRLPVSMRATPTGEGGATYTISGGNAGVVGIINTGGAPTTHECVSFNNAIANWTANVRVAVTIGLTAEL